MNRLKNLFLKSSRVYSRDRPKPNRDRDQDRNIHVTAPRFKTELKQGPSYSRDRNRDRNYVVEVIIQLLSNFEKKITTKIPYIFFLNFGGIFTSFKYFLGHLVSFHKQFMPGFFV
jgi:hypothetical protein